MKTRSIAVTGRAAEPRRFWRVASVVALGFVLAALPTHAHDDPAATLHRLDAEIAANPNDAELWRTRSVFQRRAGNFAGADADLDRSVELGLGEAIADRDRGLIRFDQGRLVDAEALLRAARALMPQELPTLLGHARALAALERFDESSATYAEIVELAPQTGPDVRLEHVRVTAASSSATAVADAIRVADAAMAAIGPVPALQRAALDLELRADDLDAALARLDRMAHGAGRRDPLLLERAQLLERAGRVEAAKQAYAQTLAATDLLPAARKTTPATRDIEAQARDGIARLARGEPQ